MSEPLFKNDGTDEEPTKHDGLDVVGSVFSRLNIWVAVLLFIVFCLMNTTIFIEDVMKKINGDFVSADGNLTSNGTIVQGLFLSLAYIIIDLLVGGGIM